jgi:hypothetical protein
MLTFRARFKVRGNLAVGAKYWYGFANPKGSQFSCVHSAATEQWNCMTAGGGYCPKQNFKGCAGHNDNRGWWTNRFETQFILYNPSDLAEVANGHKKPYEPQPYAVVRPDKNLFLNSQDDIDDRGAGDRRRYRLGAVAYDRQNDLLYVLERYADGAKPVVHVWQVR